MEVIPIFLPGKSTGQKSQVGYSPWSHKIVRYYLATKQQQQQKKKTVKKNKKQIHLNSFNIAWQDYTVL